MKKLLRSRKFPSLQEDEEHLEDLQKKFLRIQQGVWHQKKRVVIIFEGFDAAGKGGAIRRMVEALDPRGFRVYPIGPPLQEEQGRHYLYRFWKRLPEPGSIAIFDRSWYGRLLVEKVHGLVSKKRYEQAFTEIVQFETMLQNDGIELIKIFLAIDKKEQWKRFEERISDPYKQWKLTKADVTDRKLWSAYVAATDRAFKETHTRQSPWHLVAANHKNYTRIKVLEIVNDHLAHQAKWIESAAQKAQVRAIKNQFRK